MRLAIMIAVLALPGPALADCKVRPIGLSEPAYASVLLQRMRPLGIRDINRVGQGDGRDQFLTRGAEYSLFITPEDGLIREIGFVLSGPAKASEVEKLMTAVAFTLSTLGGQDETAIKSRLYDEVPNHGLGTWSETFGPATGVFGRTADGLVVKMRLVNCG